MKLQTPVSVESLAQEYNLRIIGSKQNMVTGINEIHKVESGDLAYVDNEKYYDFTLNSKATVILINKETKVPEGKTLLICDNPFAVYNSLTARYMAHLEPPPPAAGYYVSPRAEIGQNTVIYPGVYIANDVKIGKNCQIHPNVVIYQNTIIGDHVVIKANSTIGGDAFYYTNFDKWHSAGRVVIHDHVHIGAACTIDKGVSGDTVIGAHTKLDNQVHVGHGVEIGEYCLLVGQTGIGGKTRIGNRVMLLGQVAVIKDVTIGDGATVLTKSLVSKKIAEGKTYFGLPARDTKEIYRELALMKKLPEWKENVEEKLKEIKGFL